MNETPSPPYERLLPEAKIQARIAELGKQISEDYKGEDSLLLVGVLKGATFFLVDLARNIDHPDLEVDFISVSSYGMGTESSREPIINLDVRTPIRDKNVILIEDIVDTGYSLNTLLSMLRARGPKSLKVAALLSKSEARQVEVPVDYIGFEIPNRYVKGCGLDDAQQGRALRDILIQEQS